MSSTAVIVFEGVLKQNHGEGVVTQGAALYHGLKSVYKIAVVTNRLEAGPVEHWLAINSFSDHPVLLTARDTDPFEVGGTRMRQIGALRAMQSFVDIVIEPDPDIAAVLMQEGVPVANFLHPKYSRPEFRPDHDGAIRPWDSLVAEVHRQEAIRARDKRAHHDD